MTLSSIRTLNKRNRISSILLIISLFSLIIFLAYNNIIYGIVDNSTTNSTPKENGFIEIINGPFASTVLSAVVVSVIAYLAGRLRSVSLKLQVIPSLQENQVDIKKNMVDIKDLAEKNNREMKEQLERNTAELRKHLEKMDEKVDRRFDVVSDMQRSIEKDMNEKIMNLIYTMRNYNDGSSSSGINTRNNVKYKE